MNESSRILRDVARLADQLGPALAPVGQQELLRSIAEAAKDIFGAAAASIALLTEDQTELVFYVSSGAGAEDVEGMRIPSSKGIAGWVVTSGQPIAIEDVQSDARFASGVASSTGYVPRSIVAMPLQTEREIIGVISVLDRSEDAGIRARDMDLLGLFARQAALAIENSRVFTQLGHALMQSLALAADDRDLATALHEVATASNGPTSDLAELAAHFNELDQLGVEARVGATRLVREFLVYVKSRARRT